MAESNLIFEDTYSSSSSTSEDSEYSMGEGSSQKDSDESFTSTDMSSSEGSIEDDGPADAKPGCGSIDSKNGKFRQILVRYLLICLQITLRNKNMPIPHSF
ncbi:uncharacterized protein LOC108159288 [Drosophila miranda]|uniref:uncharacterized protein LOC108159288 n=1 Tax=Drosophila miranda TaxID=7229 RepID=UPI0007E64626|nr:uncharacterized protein LOC108159288 [Drosophila miranda]